MKTTENTRTKEQNRKLYWLLNHLGIIDRDAIAEIVWIHTNHCTHHTSELSFIECMELIRYLENMQKNKREKRHTDDEFRKLDKKRKRLIKAVFRWYEMQGKNVTMDYVKGTACRAAGVDKFNDISDAALTRLYAEFCRKQAAVETINGEYFKLCQN